MALAGPERAKVDTELAKTVRGARALAQGGVAEKATMIRVDTKDGVVHEVDFIDPTDLHVRTGDEIAALLGPLCAKTKP